MSLDNASELICTQLLDYDDYKKVNSFLKKRLRNVCLMLSYPVNNKIEKSLKSIFSDYIYSFVKNINYDHSYVEEIVYENIDFNKILIYTIFNNLNKIFPIEISKTILLYLRE